MTPRILVVEDEAAIGELLRINLRHAGFVPVLAASAEEGEAAIRAALPDLVILDWMLPGESGTSLAKRLRQNDRTRELPIIMLTARGYEEDKVLGLEAGADDYVTKPFSPKELIARIRALLRRRSPHTAAEVVEVHGLEVNVASHRVTAAGNPVELGPTEFRLLAFLVSHPERVHSRQQLLDKVWGDHVFIDQRMVDVHIRRLRAALEPSGLHQLIETVRGTGYRFHGGQRAEDA